jgi:3-oxoacyl-[acyl-carrier-protein] synthase III
MIHSVITATGSYIPPVRIDNEYFLEHTFYERDGVKINKPSSVLISKLKDISGITERRYALPEHNTSDLACFAAVDALESSGIDRETLDYIIVAHNFGNINAGTNRTDIVPNVASKVKRLLGIRNPDCIAYDLPFGCPGWVEALIQANYFIRSGDAKKCMVIGTDLMSRVLDPHDRDSMLFSDGSGAAIVEASDDPTKGILAHKTRTYADENNTLIEMRPAIATNGRTEQDIAVKMNGRKVYEFALTRVPELIIDLLDKNAIDIASIKKILIHQANEKMDAAILQRILNHYGLNIAPEQIMPMTISWLGNSSVATVPTLLDLILKNKLEQHTINPGDRVIFTSVGAGMNINGIVYQF